MEQREGAYILIWLSCAESIKRKFREASTRDNMALQIVNEIETTESRRQSADVLILQRAKDYELIDDVVHQKLTHIYEEIISAAKIVVDEVLSRPILYRKKYVENLIVRLITNVDFLESSKTNVAEYTQEVSLRIGPSRYKQVANSYSGKVEQMFNDPTLQAMVMRDP
jgi:Rps23 Pro-64 3,4-dihydroxylase Tpa1-like proline 4-hydroxylase